MRELVPRFSALALVSIGLVGLTGVYSAWTQTGMLVPIGTEYGRTLIMKSGFAAGALALGGLNYLDGGRMMGWLDGFRSRVTIEVLLAATVLVLTAALAITPPVEEAAGVQIEPIPDAFGEVAPGMSMQVIPGRPGVNRVVVTTIDAMAGTAAMELSLDDLDEGTSTRVPLELEGMTGMDHTGGRAGDEPRDRRRHHRLDRRCARPPARQRLGHERPRSSAPAALSSPASASPSRSTRRGSQEGQVSSLLDPTLGVAALLLLGGALGLGLGLGGARLPRCEAVASRLAAHRRRECGRRCSGR